jgi:hypothetical protein
VPGILCYMRQKPSADLDPEHDPWDIPGHRAVCAPLLQGALTRAALHPQVATRPRSGVYRIVNRLNERGVLRMIPGAKPAEVELVPRERKRLKAALKAADQTPPPGQVHPFASRPSDEGETNVVGLVQHGQVLLHVRVAPDLMGAFGRALERAASTYPNIWGTVASGQEGGYVLVADDRPGDPAALRRMLQQAGAECTALQASRIMSAAELIAHARRLRNAGVDQP